VYTTVVHREAYPGVYTTVVHRETYQEGINHCYTQGGIPGWYMYTSPTQGGISGWYMYTSHTHREAYPGVYLFFTHPGRHTRVYISLSTHPGRHTRVYISLSLNPQGGIPGCISLSP